MAMARWTHASLLMMVGLGCLALLAEDSAAEMLGPRAPCTTQQCTPLSSCHRVGCYRDAADMRAMNSLNFSSQSTMTKEACFDFCASNHFALAGVEDSSQCFCGNSVTKINDKPVPSWCTTPNTTTTPTPQCCKQAKLAGMCGCTGNANESCGGCGLLEVFNVTGFSCHIVPLAYPYCDKSLPQKERVADLMGRLTTSEKISCIGTRSCTVPRFGFRMSWAEALHGLRYQCVRDIDGRADPLCATSFPHAQLLAATFNSSLWSIVGDKISTEARGFYNLYINGKSEETRFALSFFAPDINLCRDPRWGRCLEVPSECPILSGQYGKGYISSFQGRDPSGAYYKSLANAKHWSAYDVEKGATNNGNGDPYNRGNFDAMVTNKDLLQTYWSQFRVASSEANLRGVMCSYNAVNGVPSCANTKFNNDILRGTYFNFSGMIVSDCGAVDGIGPAQHNYTHTPNETVKAALRAGTDVDCGTVYQQFVGPALQSGVLTETDVDTAIQRVLEQVVSTGQLDPIPPWADIDEEDIDTIENRQIALNAAVQGFVLLTNNGALPLKRGSKVAVIGPHLNSSTELLANYYGENLVVANATPLLGLQHRKEIDIVGVVEGCDLVNVSIPPDIKGATLAASKADVAVVFAGLHSTQGQQVNNGPGMEREGFDRTNLTLPGYQEVLIRAVKATGTPTVVVFINSGGLAAEWVYGNVDAVVEAYYPGELGGDALASVLVGEASPSGRLTNTIYPAEFVTARNITDMEMAPHVNSDNVDVPGVTYRFYDKDPLFSFGYGKTYTNFSFTWDGPNSLSIQSADLAQAAIGANGRGLPEDFKFKVNVANEGSITSDLSVLCFASASHSETSSFPTKQLIGFTRLAKVAPGQVASATIVPIPTSLTTVSNDRDEIQIVPLTYRVSCGGAPDGFINGSIQTTGAQQVLYTLPQ